MADLRMVVFVLSASTPDGKPLYSIADIVEPLARYNAKALRLARQIAGPRGYVLVGRTGLDWHEFEGAARRVDGLWTKPIRRS